MLEKWSSQSKSILWTEYFKDTFKVSLVGTNPLAQEFGIITPLQFGSRNKAYYPVIRHHFAFVAQFLISLSYLLISMSMSLNCQFTDTVLQLFVIKQDQDQLLNLKRQTEIAADDTSYFYFYLSKEIRLGVSCESSA